MNTSAPGSFGKRALAACEVALVFAAVVIVGRVLPRPFRAWQIDCFGYAFLSNLLFGFAPPLLICALTRRPPAQSGLAFGQLRSQAGIGLNGGWMLLVLVGWVFPVLERVGTSYRQWLGAVILASVELVALFVISRAVSKKRDPVAGPGSPRHVALFAALVIVAFALGAALSRVSTLGAGLVYTLVFVGFGEELLFRGYLQSRLNTAFGRPFRLFGIPWGPGLVLAAVLFGLMHPWGPWALWAAVGGMTFGMLREKGGSFVTSAIAHGLLVAPTVFFGQ